MSDRIAREPRAPPLVRIEKRYVFDTPEGPPLLAITGLTLLAPRQLPAGTRRYGLANTAMVIRDTQVSCP